MQRRSCSRRLLFLALFLAASSISAVQGVLVPYLQQAFFFDWNPAGQPYPVPVTSQCETIHIVWSRSAAQGPNNVAPYYLQVYTSIYTVPIVIPAGDGLSYDWPVPFPPGTLYQICMFDKNGNTGGCQATYTVIPSTSGEPTCANVTLPPQLDVEATVSNGPISRYGWIEQCTDIQVRPKGGTPPYTFTIAPALHPPYNLTGSGSTPLNWTIGLSWSTPFFISVADSAGNMWANGLLHSGGPGPTTACLTGNTTTTKPVEVKPSVAIGAGIGGLAVGLLIGLLSMCFFMRKKIKRLRRGENFVDLGGDHHGSHYVAVHRHSSQYHAVPSTPMGAGLLDNSIGASYPSSSSDLRRGTLQYQIEPFMMPTEEGRLVTNDSTPPPGIRSTSGSGASTSRPHNAVYVLHHDSNAPPVTIFHEDGTEIVELPPRYVVGSSPPNTNSDSRSDGRSASDQRSDGSRTETTQDLPNFLQQSRRPNQLQKPIRDGQAVSPR